MKALRHFIIIAFFILPFMSACSHAPKNDKQVVYKSAATGKRPPITPLKTQAQKPLIVIDPGHGGFDLGAQTRVNEEKKLALSTAFLLKKFLIAQGYPVRMTRTSDVFIPLKQRANIANTSKSAVFISLHYNAAKSDNAKGIEVYFFDTGKTTRSMLSKKLAQNVLSSLLNRTGAKSRGVKGGNFLVIRETKMPAILIEGGFITHQTEGKKLSEEKYLESIARAITDGVEKYFKL